jgi:hypothetical protein
MVGDPLLLWGMHPLTLYDGSSGTFLPVKEG